MARFIGYESNIQVEVHNLLNFQNAMFNLHPRCVGALRTLRLSVARNRDTTATRLMYAHDPSTTLRGWETEDYFEFIIITLQTRNVYILLVN